jgi:hypothetical protein
MAKKKEQPKKESEQEVETPEVRVLLRKVKK